MQLESFLLKKELIFGRNYILNLDKLYTIDSGRYE